MGKTLWKPGALPALQTTEGLVIDANFEHPHVQTYGLCIDFKVRLNRLHKQSVAG